MYICIYVKKKIKNEKYIFLCTCIHKDKIYVETIYIEQSKMNGIWNDPVTRSR